MRLLILFATLVFAWLAVPATAHADPQFKLLVVAIPNTYHHDYAVVARPAFESMARVHDFALTWAWDTRPFDSDLSDYAAIVLLNTPGDVLQPVQQRRFEAYVRGGGNVVAVHRALIHPPGQWPWFERLIGRAFRTHPMIQTAVVDVVAPGFPAAFALPARWIWTDEWYEFGPALVPDLHDVLRVDERSYDPTRIWPGQVATGMGEVHPVAWYHRYDGGRVFVTALGHTPELYADARYLDHLYGGIYWAATGLGIAAPAAVP